jgi:starch synthase
MKNILFLAAEVAPYVTVGGLSQVMYFLPRALKRRGFDVRIFTPKYGVSQFKNNGKGGKQRGSKLKEEVMGMAVPTNGGSGHPKELICNVLSYKPGQKHDAQMFFLENREYYELRANVYGYGDDHTRFALLAKGCLEFLRNQYAEKKRGKEVWLPDVIHCHDWHTALFIDMARRDPRYRAMLQQVPVVLSVHNFKYQGVRDFRYLRDKEKDDVSKPVAPLLADKLRNQNALKRGLIYADAVMTVSPTHAIEVMTPEYAEGLQDTLLEIRGKMNGILNGLDLEEFNPNTDPSIKRRYSSKTFAKARTANKLHLQQEFGLPENPDAFLLSFVGRLTPQKGVDLILEAMPHLIKEHPEIQLVLLGTGEDKYRKGCVELQQAFPKNVGIFLHSDFRLPKRIFSGSDLTLLPSMFEPGGIVALEALRFGSVPLVRRTGGLRDIVTRFDPVKGKGNGFLFTEKTPWALFAGVVEALTVHRQPKLWNQLVKNALDYRMTWDMAAEEYEEWYLGTKKLRRRATKRPARNPIYHV